MWFRKFAFNNAAAAPATWCWRTTTTPKTRFFTTKKRCALPVIDISPLRLWQSTLFKHSSSSCSSSSSMSSVEKDALAASLVKLGDQFRHAFETFGFCYLIGHGVSSTQQSLMLKSMHDLFSLSSACKADVSVDTTSNAAGVAARGYLGVGSESGSERIEVKEGFSYGFHGEQLLDDKRPRNPLQARNKWPNATAFPLNQRQVMEDFFDSMVQVSKYVTQGLALARNEDDINALWQYCDHGDTISIMRLFHYFPYDRLPSLNATLAAAVAVADENNNNNNNNKKKNQNPKECIGSSPHTDWGFLTLILQDPTGGLQFYHEKEWMEIPYLSDSLLVNGGDYLAMLTQGQFVSPIHRVVLSEAERFSSVFFFYPNYEACLPVNESNWNNRRGTGIGNGYLNWHSDFNNVLQGCPVDATNDSSWLKRPFGEFIASKWASVGGKDIRVKKKKHGKT